MPINVWPQDVWRDEDEEDFFTRDQVGADPTVGEEPHIVAVIPAHNEEEQIDETVQSLLPQVDEVIVVADNCTDGTEQAAAQAGATVIRTFENTAKKAGALNQILKDVLPWLSDMDAVLVVDADSTLAPNFVSEAVVRLNDGYSAVGGNFRGKEGGGIVGMLQRNEYARYARDVARRQGRCLVLTGTAALFRVGALRDISESRESGDVYDVEVLTEDNELTLRLLHLGHRIISPKECTLTTEVMPTWRQLANQRLRWKRGAFQNLSQYGWTTVTRPYWGRQVLAALGVLAAVVYVASIAVGAIVGMEFHPFWIALTGVFMVERSISVRERGWRQMALGALILVEMVYDTFLQFVQARAYLEIALRRSERW